VEIHIELLSAEGLRVFGRPRHRWENNSIVDIGEVWDDSVDWVNLTEDMVWWWALVDQVMTVSVP